MLVIKTQAPEFYCSKKTVQSVKSVPRSEESYFSTSVPFPKLDELIRRVAKDREVDLKVLLSSKRTQKISNTRAIISYLAAIELRNSGKEIAPYLNLSPRVTTK